MARSGNVPDDREKRKLIEVGIPLDVISAEAAREKSIRHGHPSTLHLWWARRPLAACRAVLFAQLVDDPSAHPDRFDSEAKQDAERKELHRLISELVKWENIHNEDVLSAARKKIKESCDGSPPPILDPFAGGGSIPLEAQRLGLDACARDLNPVAVLINKALIEIPAMWADRPPVFPGAAEEAMSWPRATGLAEDVQRYGRWMRDEAERRIGKHYPKVTVDGTEAPVIAWIWARTITCRNPRCRRAMPLVGSFWLGRKPGKERYIHPVAEDGHVRYEIRGPRGLPRDGTASGDGAICLLCDTPVESDFVKNEGRAHRMGAQLMVIVAQGHRRRHYLPPNAFHESAAVLPRPGGLPEGELEKDTRNLWCAEYGLTAFTDLFTSRQLTALVTFSDLVRESRERVISDGATAEYADAVATYLALAVSRVADRNSSICTWDCSPKMESIRNALARQALPMTWDFVEGNPFSKSAGNLLGSIRLIVECLKKLPALPHATVKLEDAALGPTYGRLLVATDPPYYDNISYANVSDFFYVWLRRSLEDIYPDLLGTVLSPKQDEIIADAERHGGRDQARRFYEERFEMAFRRICEDTPSGYPISFFYAYKQTETDKDGIVSTAWEILLDRLLSAGWTVTGAWPIKTELRNRMRGRNSNALGSSVVLSCRPRPKDAKVTDRRGLIAALRDAMPAAVRTLESAHLAPGDLRQAMIGPGMKVFSGYVRVNEPDGRRMSVRTALKLINQVFDEYLTQLGGDVSADTRWCVEWYRQHGFDAGSYDEATKLARGANTDIEALRRAEVVQASSGIVRLLTIGEIPHNYDPVTDTRVSEWKICLHLAKRLNKEGSEPAVRLMVAARRLVELDHVRDLAQLLYSIADTQGWPQTAALFNALGQSWPDIESESRKPSYNRPPDVQERLLPPGPSFLPIRVSIAPRHAILSSGHCGWRSPSASRVGEAHRSTTAATVKMPTC
jgi:putative DNA methylase